MLQKNYAISDNLNCPHLCFLLKLNYTRMSHTSAVEQNKFHTQFKAKHKLSKHRTHPQQTGI